MKEYLQVVLVLFVYYLILFVVGQVKKNNSIIDIYWGFGFVLAALFSIFSTQNYSFSSVVVCILVSVWGLRLTYHIGKRNRGKAEDFRYVNMRKQWGDSFVYLKAFLHVYMLQLIMLLLISSAYLNIILVNRSGLKALDILGIFVWLLGFYFESKSDHELKTFKADKSNKGKIMKTGLFKYSRHPNYFGEAIMWWGLYMIGLSSNGIWFIISPITITVLVRFISGVPLLEKHYENNKEFQAYAQYTNIFIPWFPKHK